MSSVVRVHPPPRNAMRERSKAVLFILLLSHFGRGKKYLKKVSIQSTHLKLFNYLCNCLKILLWQRN